MGADPGCPTRRNAALEQGKRHEPSHRLVARALGVAIVTGQHLPGQLLPPELELAETRGISRSVVREALRALSAKGLIDSRPKAGTRVRPRSAWNLLDPELLGWMFEGAPPLGFVRSLFELRLIIEPAAAAIAADRRSAAQLADMEKALAAMESHGLASAEGQTADQEFHRVLLDATDNELLTTLAAGITAAVRWTTYFKYRASRQPHDATPQHRTLLEAIARSDVGGAREATVALIHQARIDTEVALGA